MNIEQSMVVITGATGGIGAAVAKQLAVKGAKLLLVARNSANLKALQQQLNLFVDTENHLTTGAASSGERYHYLSADITTEQGKADIIAKAESLQANMLINSAGVSDFSYFSNITEQALQQTININLTAPIALTQLFLGQNHEHAEQAKYVVNIGSALGSIGFSCYSSYCAAKFGLRGFTESLQRELAHSKHKILYFAPRATATDINSDAANEMNAALGNNVDTPDEVAKILIKQIISEQPRVTVGWPEKLFVRLNGLLPELVDKALGSKLEKIKYFARTRESVNKSVQTKAQAIAQHYD